MTDFPEPTTLDQILMDWIEKGITALPDRALVLLAEILDGESRRRITSAIENMP